MYRNITSFGWEIEEYPPRQFDKEPEAVTESFFPVSWFAVCLGLLNKKATKDSFLPRTGCNETSRSGEVNILLTNPCWEPPKVIPKNIYIHEL